MATAQHHGDRKDGHPLELKNVVVSTVKPAEKNSHPEKYDASLFDMFVPDMYLPILMVFRPDRSRADQTICNALEFITRIKHSLSRILVPYYTLAGRSRKIYDVRLRELLCNDEGVPFIEAEIDEDLEKVVNIDDFQPLSILSGYEFLGFDPLSSCEDHGDFPLPTAFIQVTKFRCGGISVNFNFLHIVGDAKAIFQFLKDWSQMTLDDQLSFEPIHDRSLTYPASILLDMMAGGSKTSTVSELENLEDVVKEENSQIMKNGDETLPIHDREYDEPEVAPRLIYSMSEWTRKTLHVRGECVEKFKQVAKDRNDGFVPTTLDCIQTHLWRGASRIPSSIDGRKSTIYGFAVEGRQRLHETPIPDSYSGNDFIAIFTQPLEQPSDDLLGEARSIQKLVRSVTPHSWLSKFVHGRTVMKSDDSRIISATSWYRFPMYEVDFGFGKPVLASFNSVASMLTSLSAVIMPPRPASDFLATVQLCMAPEILSALLNDTEFRSFFH